MSFQGRGCCQRRLESIGWLIRIGGQLDRRKAYARWNSGIRFELTALARGDLAEALGEFCYLKSKPMRQCEPYVS
ncbi:hypothetical protein Q31b_02350 [Novipirellula aureliae]|uniref:Uncharacterized protein n=1 Tax=Novipirellula aureliae TaxID=2527966 RepID=A0A5C6E8Z7_9BACT|nr:hypothetical protein Q31b_02350 [Novipirellula aureliae]